MVNSEWAAFDNKLTGIPSPAAFRAAAAVPEPEPEPEPPVDEPTRSTDPETATHTTGSQRSIAAVRDLPAQDRTTDPGQAVEPEDQVVEVKVTGESQESARQAEAPRAPRPVRATGSRGRASTSAQPARKVRVSAKERAAQKAAQSAADQVAAVLRASGVHATVSPVSATDREAIVDIKAPDTDSVLDALVDVCEAFGLEDADAEVSGSTVTVWLPVVSDGPARQRAAWVPDQVRAAVRTHGERTGESVTQLVLTAFNLYHDQLGEWFEATDQVSGPMSVDSARRRAPVDSAVQLWMYLKPQQNARLDAAARACGAGSRSELVTALLERYFAEHSS